MTLLCSWLGATTTTAGCVPRFEDPPAQPVVVPGPGGQFRDFTSTATFDAALAAANPGDVLRQTATFVGRIYALTGRSGAAGNHIKITRVPGVEVIGTGDLNNVGTVDVGRCSHVDVIGLKIRGGQFGLRALNLVGTIGSPCQVGWNEVSHTGHAHVAVQGWNQSGTWSPSTHVRVVANNIHSPSATVTALDQRIFNEGLYLGYGSTEWVDGTNNLYVAHNDIWDLPSDGIDLKPGVINSTIELNTIHDIVFNAGAPAGPIAGISVSYGASAPPINNIGVTVRWNRLWNIQAPTGYGSDAYFNPIIVGQAGTTVEQNLIWDYDGHGIYIRGEGSNGMGNGTISIRGNTMAGKGWFDDPATPGAARTLAIAGNIRGVSGLSDYLASLTPGVDFLGPVTGTADHGEGPGSGFFLEPDSGANNSGTITTSLSTRCPDTVNHFGAMPSLVAP